MKRLFLVLALLLTSLAHLYSQTPAETHKKIRTALDRGEYAAVIADLEGIAKRDRKMFEANNYDYLLARMAEKTGDVAKAMANYQSVVKRNSLLKEYALWHISQIARSSGNLMLERLNLQELTTLYPGSSLFIAARSRLARSHFESANYDDAIRLLGDPPSLSNSGVPKAADTGRLYRDNRAIMGRAYLYKGDPGKAREIFLELINNQANPTQPDDFALAAVKGLDLLDGGQESFGKTAPKIPDNDHLQRARIYQFNRDFNDARLHYLAIIQDYPTSSNVADATYQLGRCFAQQTDYAEAIKWFEQVQEKFPNDLISRDALSQSASAYSRLGKYAEAIARYQKFIEKYPDDERIDRPYLNLIDVYRDSGNDDEALKWAAKTQEVFKGKLSEALALFSQARIRIAKSDWASALTDLDRLLSMPDLGGTRVPGGTNTAEIKFLNAYALEQIQRFPEAIDVYLSIPDGRAEYYGWKASERLKALAGNEASRSSVDQKLTVLSAETKDTDAKRRNIQAALRLTEAPEIRNRLFSTLKTVYAALPAYQKIPAFDLVELGRTEVLKDFPKPGTDILPTKAHELLFLGLYDEGTHEMANILSVMGSMGTRTETPSGDTRYTLAVYFRRADIAYKAVSFAEPLWKNVPADYQIELIPPDQAMLLYPAPYTNALLKYAPGRNVDPRFLLSIMRQESRYMPDVKSYAAARGLMQFISDTSNKIAADLGRKNFKQDELYDPPTAILFGSQYVSNIFKLFPGKSEAVAASYNGGEDNMKRWLARSRSDLTNQYVPEIVFSQSKDYVYKVMANYRMYSVLYDENLKPR